MAHPIRPESHIAMDNFYTLTVYEKGAEVIRMYKTLVGTQGFRKGMDLYFERHDGSAVTCDDFRAAMADGSGKDLTQFERWYLQAGTPTVSASSTYDAASKLYKLTLSQSTPPTPGQPEKLPFHIPVVVGLLDAATGAEVAPSRTPSSPPPRSRSSSASPRPSCVDPARLLRARAASCASRPSTTRRLRSSPRTTPTRSTGGRRARSSASAARTRAR